MINSVIDAYKCYLTICVISLIKFHSSYEDFFKLAVNDR